MGPTQRTCPAGTGSGAVPVCPTLRDLNEAAGAAAAFQVNYQGYNNVAVCASNRGCGSVNQGPNDQFLMGASISGDMGTWVSYFTYNNPADRSPASSINTHAFYYPPVGNPAAAVTASGIPATSWWPGTANRCAQNVYCYVQGDYVSIASNSFAGASTPFITSGGSFNAFRQLFLVDPPGDPIAGNFKPNFVPFPAGADLRAQGKEHGQQGADPGRRHERRKQ